LLYEEVAILRMLNTVQLVTTCENRPSSGHHQIHEFQ